MYENRVYNGIPRLLQELRARGKKLIVATSKPTEFSIQILQYFALDHFFDAVFGSNLDGTRVEKAEVIEFALSQLVSNNRSATIMVGDRKHDVIGAKANNIDVIGVTYGYGGYDELSAAQPTHIVVSVEELGDLLESERRGI
jgi:phosphoglycolate phosphatase